MRRLLRDIAEGRALGDVTTSPANARMPTVAERDRCRSVASGAHGVLDLACGVTARARGWARLLGSRQRSSFNGESGWRLVLEPDRGIGESMGDLGGRHDRLG